MSKQLYHKGDLVQVLVGHQIFQTKLVNGKLKTKTIELSPEDIGRKAIICYSYSEKYGGNKALNNDYSIMFCDTGETVSWKSAEELKLIKKDYKLPKKLIKAFNRACDD